MYHDPCHTPMKTHAPLAVVNGLMGAPVALNERCCGESGMLATSRPDISTQVRFRKEAEMRKGAGSYVPRLTAEGKVHRYILGCMDGSKSVEDIAVFSSLLNFRVIVPADVVEAAAAVEAAARTPGPFLIRTGRARSRILYPDGPRFRLGVAPIDRATRRPAAKTRAVGIDVGHQMAELVSEDEGRFH
jgi:hypothetical protein